jgi:hypothetical protein
MEADDNLGGRAKSFALNGAIYDAGAHWFHCGEDNRFYQFLKKRYELTEGDFILDRLKHAVAIEEPGVFGPTFYDTASQILGTEYARLQREMPGCDISLATLARRTKNTHVINAVMPLGCTWAGVLPDVASAREIYEDRATSGGLQSLGGMAKPLCRMIDEAKELGVTIKTGIRITSFYETNGRCTLTDQRGNEYLADQVNVTFSIGVLKHGQQFGSLRYRPSPELTAYLKDMQMANLMKITLAFDSDYLNRRKARVDGRLYFQVGDLTGFIHERSAGNPGLTLYFGGPCAVHVGQSRDRLGEIIDQVLSHSGKYPDYRDHLRGVHVSDPNANSDFHGAYSAALPGAVRRGPLQDGTVIYSGEAWAPIKRSSGTVEAANWSGKHAAKMMFRNLKPRLDKSPPSRQRGGRQDHGAEKLDACPS